VPTREPLTVENTAFALKKISLVVIVFYKRAGRLYGVAGGNQNINGTIWESEMKREYVTPKCTEKGDIAALTQENKTFGAGDGFFLVIPGTDPIAITNYS
jgi:hypothetical protein